MINNSLTLSDRQWACDCGSIHNRDLNAAENIRREGLKQLAAGQAESLNACGAGVRLIGAIGDEARIPPALAVGSVKHKPVSTLPGNCTVNICGHLYNFSLAAMHELTHADDIKPFNRVLSLEHLQYKPVLVSAVLSETQRIDRADLHGFPSIYPIVDKIELPITKEQYDAYFKQKGLWCPHCLSNDLRNTIPVHDTIGAVMLTQRTCAICGLSWVERVTRRGSAFDLVDNCSKRSFFALNSSRF